MGSDNFVLQEAEHNLDVLPTGFIHWEGRSVEIKRILPKNFEKYHSLSDLLMKCKVLLSAILKK